MYIFFPSTYSQNQHFSKLPTPMVAQECQVHFCHHNLLSFPMVPKYPVWKFERKKESNIRVVNSGSTSVMGIPRLLGKGLLDLEIQDPGSLHQKFTIHAEVVVYSALVMLVCIGTWIKCALCLVWLVVTCWWLPTYLCNSMDTWSKPMHLYEFCSHF